MFDLGWTELLLIGIVALIVVGPKDLPIMFRTLGKYTGRLRGMAREFTRAMNDAADQAGVSEINKTIKAAANPARASADALKDAVNLGPETTKLAEDRAEAKRKMDESMAQKALDRKAREAAEMEAELAAKSETAAAEPAPAPEVKE